MIFHFSFLFNTLLDIISFLFIVLPVLISVAYLTLAERNIMGSIQNSNGPNFVGFIGLLQPLADGLKLLLNETVIPNNSSVFSFILAPIITLVLSLLSWSTIPFSLHSFFSNNSTGLLFLFAISSLGVYGIILSGWSSNSSYAFFGCLSSTAQMISYEVSIGLILISALLFVGSLSLIDVITFQSFVFFVIPLVPLFLLFLVSILAETNRAPFDLPEAESELVSGYNVEYASMGFALFFLAEYSSMILMSCLTSIIFLGGWVSFSFLVFDTMVLSLSLKLCLILFFFIWVSASFPSYSIDQLMRLCWNIFLPVSLSFVIFILCIICFTNSIC